MRNEEQQQQRYHPMLTSTSCLPPVTSRKGTCLAARWCEQCAHHMSDCAAGNGVTGEPEKPQSFWQRGWEGSWTELGQGPLQALRPGPSPPVGPKGSCRGAVPSLKTPGQGEPLAVLPQWGPQHLPWGHGTPWYIRNRVLGAPAQLL